jgi:hypothetical protein
MYGYENIYIYTENRTNKKQQFPYVLLRTENGNGNHLFVCCKGIKTWKTEVSFPWLANDERLLFQQMDPSVLRTVAGKLLLKSNCVTLLPLLLKETSYFSSFTHFSL